MSKFRSYVELSESFNIKTASKKISDFLISKDKEFALFSTHTDIIKDKDNEIVISYSALWNRDAYGKGNPESEMTDVLDKLVKKFKFINKYFTLDVKFSDDEPVEDDDEYMLVATITLIAKDNAPLGVDLLKELGVLPKSVLLSLKSSLKNTKELSKILNNLISKY